ncbi:MAG TPA: hemerythrin domain-containing protein, partial [Acidimicrobiales bacterium]|nr:hemerythrin domain-containing protein [Acidimicrobiales bacterium]
MSAGREPVFDEKELEVTDAAPIPADTSDMLAVHRVFRESLAAAPALIGSAAGDDDRRALIGSYYSNIMAFLEVHHDGEEALVFPLLLERAPVSGATIEEVAGQHGPVVGLMTSANGHLASWQ